MLGRFPEGVDRRGWGQFECRGRPEWMASASLRLRTGVVRDVCVINDLASLVWVANQGVIELHPYLARVERFDQPLAAVFDLDPGPPAGLRECCRVALWLRDVLTEVGLSSFPKTSGSSGLHVVVPLNAPHSYEETKRFARAAAARLARERGELVVDRMAKSLRARKVFIDWAQNDQRKQTVAPYSLRATPMPLVSAPVRWDEIERAVEGSSAAALTLGPRDVLRRLAAGDDPFADVARLEQRLPPFAPDRDGVPLVPRA